MAGWPKTIIPCLPIGLLLTNQLLREELLSLAYAQAEIHIRILSAHLKSAYKLRAWLDEDDCVYFSTLDVTMMTTLWITILVPCLFEVIQPDATQLQRGST